MVTIKTKLITQSPFHTGSDSKQGNMMTIRKDNVINYSGEEILTKFANEEDLNNGILTVLFPLYRAMNNDFKKAHNSYGGYDLFFAFVRKALANSNSWIEFQSQILELIDADNIFRGYREKFREIIKTLVFSHFKTIFTKNQNYLKTEIVFAVQTNNENIENWKKENNGQYEGYEEDSNFPYEIVENGFSLGYKNHEIPVIAGNSIKGKIRRLAYYEFLNLIEVKKSDITNPFLFDFLVIGGSLLHKPKKGNIEDIKGTISDFYFNPDGIVNIKNRIEALQNIPYLSLLGASFGTQTITSSMRFSYAKLKCKENGTGEIATSDLLDIIFFTHKDDSNLAKHAIQDSDKKTSQMKFDIEVVKTNSIFETEFSINYPKNPTEQEKLELSCFYWILDLFQKDAQLGGRNNQGEGKMLVEYFPKIDFEKETNLFISKMKKQATTIKKYLQI